VVDALTLCPASLPPGACINWSAPAGCCTPGLPQPKPSSGVQEALQGGEGYKSGASKAQLQVGKAQSRLCKASLALQAVEAIAAVQKARGAVQGAQVGRRSDGLAQQQQQQEEVPAEAAAAAAPHTLSGRTYWELKQQLGGSYQATWARLLEHVPLFKCWICKDPALEAFRLAG
jgi:hypothetical protein